MNPVIGKIYIEHVFTVNCIEKTKIKEKEAGNGAFLKNIEARREKTPKMNVKYFCELSGILRISLLSLLCAKMTDSFHSGEVSCQIFAMKKRMDSTVARVFNFKLHFLNTDVSTTCQFPVVTDFRILN